MPRLGGLPISHYPLKNAVKVRLRLNVVFRCAVLDALRRSRGNRCHRKVSIANTRPIDLTAVGQSCLVVSIECKRVATLLPFDVAVNKSNGLGFDVVKVVVIDRVVAETGTDEQLCIRHGLAAFLKVNGEVGNVAVGTKNKAFLDLYTARVGHRKFDRLFLTGSKRDRIFGL